MRLPVTSRRCCLQDFLEHGDLYCVFQWLDLFAVVKTFLELQAFMVLFREINYLMHFVIRKPYVCTLSAIVIYSNAVFNV